MTILYELCERIAELRWQSRITQAELANSWEMGLSIPQLKHVIEMSKIFNTTVDSMLKSPEQVVVNITDLTKEEQQAVFNLVDCLKKYHTEK